MRNGTVDLKNDRGFREEGLGIVRLEQVADLEDTRCAPVSSASSI